MNGSEWAFVILTITALIVCAVALSLFLSGMTPTTGIGS